MFNDFKLFSIMAILYFSATPQSNATAIATLHITEFKIELRDIDTNDGISPSLIFPDAPVNTIYLEQKSNDPYYWSYGNIFHGNDLFSPISNSLTYPFTSGEVHINGSPYMSSGMSMYSTSTAYGSLGEATFSNSGMFLSTTGVFEKFLLSANTELLVSAIIESSSYAYPNEKPNHKEFAYTYAETSLKGDVTVGDYQNNSESRSTFAGLDTDIEYDSILDNMAVSFINNTNSTSTGFLYVAATTESYSNAGEIQPIDEPESTMLIIIGLTLLLIKKSRHLQCRRFKNKISALPLSPW